MWKENHDNILNKRKITTYKKYGVEHVGQSKDVQYKIIQAKKLKVEELEKIYNCTQQRKLFKLYGQGWKSLGLEKIVIDGRKFISNSDISLIEQYINEGPHSNKYVSHKKRFT